VPQPPAKTDMTQDELDRAALAGELCQHLADQNCLDGMGQFIGSVSAQAIGCSRQDRVVACQQDSLLWHLGLVPAPCESAWRALIRCGIDAEYTAEMCRSIDPHGIRHDSGEGPCTAEELALSQCLGNNNTPTPTVTGRRATCSYRNRVKDSQCEVSCEVRNTYFWSECSGPAGLPLECSCNVDIYRLHDTWADRYQFYVSDCRDAAQTLADGECINRLDCCFTYFGNSGSEHCECTSDPGYRNGQTCEELAREGGGRVVDICPQYKPDPGNCFPPSICP
jgi:hypothetical protein